MHHVPVETACQPTENGVRAWTLNIWMGLLLSEPALQLSWQVALEICFTLTSSGGPGGPWKICFMMTILEIIKFVDLGQGYLICHA